MITAEQIEKNWAEFRDRVNTLFPDRADKLNEMYDYFEDRIAMMPAAPIAHYHNAFPGGYIDHVLRVMDCSKLVYDTWETAEGDLSEFTMEELMFAAMHHDLGKVGFPVDNGEIYQENDSEWHIKNQGKIYKINPNNPFTMVPDLSLYLLHTFGVKMSWEEYLAIRIHDGIYADANKPYFISRTEESKLRTAMPHILHQADLMAATIEYQKYRNEKNNSVAPVTKPKKPGKTISASDVSVDDMFKDFFGEK